MYYALAPLSAIYALVTDIRNWMFDRGWLQERHYPIPVLCIGNLAVGGTGKTPHCEWLVSRLLEHGKRVAILSRGYGRKTKGFREASPGCRAEEIGDEPLQMYIHFEEKVIVAVSESRRMGIEGLLQMHPDLDVIVLDDAFQHRYVHPSFRILLTEFSTPYYNDWVLPAGRLRERRRGAQRADIIIVTKCPDVISSDLKKAIIGRIAPKDHQHIFFSKMEYAPIPELTPHLDDEHPQLGTVPVVHPPVALLAGIAHPEPFLRHFEEEGYDIRHTLFYPDHHNFTPQDMAKINAMADDVEYIITTAKDCARLRSLPLNTSTLKKIKVQHISVHVLDDEETLYQTLKPYVDTH